MTPAAVLAQTGSVANWVSAIGQWVGAIGTITVARWGDRVHELNEDGEEYEVGDRYGGSEDGEEYVQVLQPHMSTGGVQYQYFDAHGQTVSTSTFFNERIPVADVAITFDISGARWRHTGNREPVRIAQPAPTQPLRAQVVPFVADWISRIRRHVHRR